MIERSRDAPPATNGSLSGRRIRSCRLAASILLSLVAVTLAFNVLPLSTRSRLHPYEQSSSREEVFLSVTPNKNGASRTTSAPQKRQQKRRKPPTKAQQIRWKSIALNKELVQCESATDVLDLLEKTPSTLTKTAGGGALNSVNLSTALHRMARYASYHKDARLHLLRDPRFALLFCSLCEGMAGLDYTQSLADNIEGKLPKKETLSFNSRERSNIAWAIAKLRFAPPFRDVPMDSGNMAQTSLKLRMQVLKQQNQQPSWIPTLSLLSGQLLDSIAHSILNEDDDAKSFNTQEMANLLWAMATAQRASPEVFDQISESLISQLTREAKPQELSNSVWAFGTAQIFGKGQAILLNHVAEALQDASYVQSFKAQELSNTAWGVATIFVTMSNNGQEIPLIQQQEALQILRPIAREIAERADEFKSQELSNTVWAFATLGFGVVPRREGADTNDYLFLETSDIEGDRQLMSSALRAVAESALSRLRVFRSQELNNLAWAFCRLERVDETELYEGIGRELSNPRRSVAGQDIGTTLWSFATLEYFDDNAYRMILSRLVRGGVNKFNPQELSNSLWALATAGVEVKYPDAFDTTLVPQSLRPSDLRDDPVTSFFEAAANELIRRPHQFKSQEIKDVLWSFSKAGIRHPNLFKCMAEHLVGRESDAVPIGQIHCGRGVDDFSPQGIGNLLWSYSKQAQSAMDTVDRVEGLTIDTTGRLLIYSTICIDIGEALVKRLFNACAEADITIHDDLAKLKSQDFSNTAWSFANLGFRHTRFFEAVSRQVVKRLSNGASFKGQELANIVWACATLNSHFPELLDAVATYMCRLCGGDFNAQTIAKHFKRQELGNIAWSCAIMGHYPPDLMRLLYAGLVGNTPQSLNAIFNDGGLQRQAIMSLLYVQMAVDMEYPTNDLSLPENFPDGWDASSSDNDDMLDEETFSMLTLSTSRIQMDVSNALDRIGFSHVEEHVIDMEELVHNHDIHLSQLQILSIDIANVDKKVGIEVDGPGHFVSVLDAWSPQEPPRGYARVVNGKIDYQFEWDGRQQEMNGSTTLKERLLRRLGWDILHIPFWEWYSLNGDSAKEDEYCRAKLLEQQQS